MAEKSTKQIGDLGEDRAVAFLQEKGYRLLERNFRTRFGEVDIIMQDDDALVFVEVKAKASNRFGSPGEMINYRKQQKLKNMALTYVAENNYEGSWRIDAVLIEGNKIEHVEAIDLT